MSNLDYIPNNYARGYIASRTDLHQGVHVPLSFIDICNGNMHDAILFSQIMYWHEPSKETQKPRLKHQHDGHLWLYKNHGDWYKECRIKAPTVRKCLSRLKEMGLIIYEVGGTAGNPTPFMRINWDVFEAKMKKWESQKPIETPDTIGHTPDTIGQGGMIQQDIPLSYEDISNTETTQRLQSENKTDTFIPSSDGESQLAPSEKVSPDNVALNEMQLAVKKLLKQYDRSIQKQVAEILLGVAKGKNKDSNIEGKMTPEMLADFCTWWDANKVDRQSGKPFTRPYRVSSVKNNVQTWLDDIYTKRQQKGVVAPKRKDTPVPASPAITDEYRARVGLPDITVSEMPEWLIEANGNGVHET